MQKYCHDILIRAKHLASAKYIKLQLNILSFNFSRGFLKFDSGRKNESGWIRYSRKRKIYLNYMKNEGKNQLPTDFWIMYSISWLSKGFS